MILGRPSNLWLGAFTALFNVAALSHFITPTTELTAGVNIAAGAIIALIAYGNTSALKAEAAKNGSS